MTSSHDIGRAMALQQAGRLDEAGAICRRILKANPADVEALYVLGTAQYQSGDAAAAARQLGKAAALAPGRAEVLNMLALALWRLDRTDEAERHLRRAIELAPAASQPYNNLGSLLKQRGRMDEAVACHRKAVELDDGNPNAHYNLGNTLRAAGRLDDAAACFRKALAARPDFGDAMANLGETLAALNCPAEAAAVLKQAAEALPDDAGVLAELGDVLQTLRRRPEAVEAYRGALGRDAGLLRAYYGLGCAQAGLEQFADAAVCFRRVLSVAPDHAASHHNLAGALFKLGQVDEAMRHFHVAAAADPTGPALTAIAVGIPGAPQADNRSILEARQRWAETFAPAAAETRTFRRDGAAGRRLRVGYVSAFFQDRNWMKPVWGLINRHDRGRFDVHVFSDSPADEIPPGYRPDPADHYHDTTGLTNEQLAERIEQEQIDLLVDLNGYSATGRLGLFAPKPAPVVAGWFNLYATTALRSFDYLIGDAHAVGPEEERFYTERIVRVPGSYLSFEVTYPVPDVAPAPCLAGGGFTFGCLASQYKLTPQVLAAWARILARCPGSRLLLKNAALGRPDNRSFVLNQLAELGVEDDRVQMDGPAEHYTFLTTYDQIDLALDTFPYNGGTTTTEAIWQGVGVLTFVGNRWAGRTSTSILRAAGLDEFVAPDLAGYVEAAVRLATDPAAPARLNELRSGMRSRLARSPACDMDAFARNMEALYEQMWREHEQRGG